MALQRVRAAVELGKSRVISYLLLGALVVSHSFSEVSKSIWVIPGRRVKEKLQNIKKNFNLRCWHLNTFDIVMS